MTKKYTPNEKEKYMCQKHKKYFKKKLIDWKNEIMESNAKGLYLNEVDREISSADIIDQESSFPARMLSGTGGSSSSSSKEAIDSQFTEGLEIRYILGSFRYFFTFLPETFLKFVFKCL